jgi:putative Holliday junction resolvase
MDRGVRLACDVGSTRIGVATCDPDGILCTPLPAVRAGAGAFNAIVSLIKEMGAIEVIVGLPIRMDGTEGPAAVAAREWAQELMKHISVPCVFVDERLSTVEAQRSLHAQGLDTRASRPLIDSAAAAVILEAHLSQQRRQEQT